MKISKDATGLLSIDGTTYPAKTSIRIFQVQDAKPIIIIRHIYKNENIKANWADIAFSDPAVASGAPYTKDNFDDTMAQVKAFLL